jgi:hypothetical protein
MSSERRYPPHNEKLHPIWICVIIVGGIIIAIFKKP